MRDHFYSCPTCGQAWSQSSGVRLAEAGGDRTALPAAHRPRAVTGGAHILPSEQIVIPQELRQQNGVAGVAIDPVARKENPIGDEEIDSKKAISKQIRARLRKSADQEALWRPIKDESKTLLYLCDMRTRSRHAAACRSLLSRGARPSAVWI